MLFVRACSDGRRRRSLQQNLRQMSAVMGGVAKSVLQPKRATEVHPRICADFHEGFR